MREEAGGWTYIMASARNGTLYTGSARDLVHRVREHRELLRRGFTCKHGVTRLVWFEAYDCVAAAYAREQRIKRWRRAWKLALIEAVNPQWLDLYETITSNIRRVSFIGDTLPGRIPGLEPGCDQGPRG